MARQPRGPGRPREITHARVPKTWNIPLALDRALRKRAKENDVSVNALVTAILAAYVQDKDEADSAA